MPQTASATVQRTTYTTASELGYNHNHAAEQAVPVKFTVCIDGGGSGCRLRAYDAAGNACASAEAGPAQLSLDIEQTWSNIREGIALLASQLGQPAQWMPDILSIGIAGALHEERRRQFLLQIPTGIHTKIVTDGHAQLLGACNAQAGVCLSVGTGSVVHWLDNSSNYGMAGGWGFPAGDEGAGAWLGLTLLIRYCRYRDAISSRAAENHAAQTVPPVYKALQQRIGCTVTDIQQWTTCKNPTELAGLVPLIVDASAAGDAVAAQLLNDGAEFCVTLLACAPSDLPVYVVGGLSSVYKPLLANNGHLSNRLAEPAADALAGLYLLANSKDAGLLYQSADQGR